MKMRCPLLVAILGLNRCFQMDGATGICAHNQLN
jgi:hypothetical protein